MLNPFPRSTVLMKLPWNNEKSGSPAVESQGVVGHNVASSPSREKNIFGLYRVGITAAYA